MVTEDAAATGRFYSGAFGWDLADMGEDYGHYTVASLRGKRVAAITPPPPGTPMPSVWSVYLKTDHAASSLAAIEKSGGAIMMAPMEVPGKGTMFMASDPTGPSFGVWQPGGHSGAELYAENGAICWAEIHTADGAAADAFYTAAFPLTGEVQTDMDYTVFKVGDEMVAGRGPMLEGEPPSWLVYFQVAEADVTASKIRELGGQVTSEPMDTPYGRIAVAKDPNGATFAVITAPTA